MEILTFTTLFPNATRPNLGVFVFQRTAHIAQIPGVSVRVVSPVPYFPAWLPIQKWQLYSRIPHEDCIHGLNAEYPRYPLLPGILMPLHGFLMFLGSLNSVRRLHREFQFDCIDAHYVYPDGFAAILLGKTIGVPVFVSARGTDINLFPEFRTIRPMIRWVFRHAAGLIAVSQALRDRMVELGASPEKIAVIPNGVDAKRFRAIGRQEARKQLGLDERAPIVISVASLTPGKRHELLIRALTETVKNRADLKAYFIGEGPLHSELAAQIQKAGLASNVFLAGGKPNEELWLWFNAADVTCLVSSREGWPNVLMESIACGTPIVATAVGGVPEIVTSEKIGILVEGKSNSIASGIDAALSRVWDRSLLVEYAEKHTWDSVARNVITEFKSVLEKSPANSG